MEALGKMRHVPAMKAIASRLGHESAQIRAMAARSLGLMRAPGASEPLLASLATEKDVFVRSAIEECLRFNGPMKGTMRAVAEDMQIGGVDIRKGDRVMLLMGSANRDPEQFADPDRLDISRNPNPHMAFGHGIHFCLGAPLARLEVEISLVEMTKRYPDLRLAAPVKYEPRILSRAIQSPLSVQLR